MTTKQTIPIEAKIDSIIGELAECIVWTEDRAEGRRYHSNDQYDLKCLEVHSLLCATMITLREAHRAEVG